MRSSILRAIIFSAVTLVPAIAQTSDEPVVAFVTGTTLNLATSSGEITQKIDAKNSVYNFALSRDRKLLVTVSADTATGGSLYLLNLQTYVQTRLTNRHLYFKAKELGKGETEVYNDPQFSPDGRRLAFAIHTDNPGDGNDAINDSGPIAVMSLETRKVSVLKSTENIGGEGLCFANTPMWSPDGKWILFNCENGAFITDVGGTTIRELKLGTEKNTMAYATSWVGNSCILTVQNIEVQPDNNESEEVLVFSLHTSQSRSPAALFASPKWTVTGLIEASESAFIHRSDSGISIETNEKTWSFPKIQQEFMERYSWRAPAAHIIGGWHPSSIPQECK